MSVSDNFLAHWYYHVPNLILAAMIYTIVGRYALELLFEFFGGRKDAVILTTFRGITDPILKLVRLVTPLIVPNGIVIVLSIAWLLALRLAWFLVCTLVFGMRIKIGA